MDLEAQQFLVLTFGCEVSISVTLQVEVWLNRLLDAMRETILHELEDAVVAYEEKPRDQWLFDFPAQVALCGSQIWWSTEVNISFSRLEEGYENALKDYNKKQVGMANFYTKCVKQLVELMLFFLHCLTGKLPSFMTLYFLFLGSNVECLDSEASG